MNTTATEDAVLADLEAKGPIRIRQVATVTWMNALANLTRKGLVRFSDGAYRLNRPAQLHAVPLDDDMEDTVEIEAVTDAEILAAHGGAL